MQEKKLLNMEGSPIFFGKGIILVMYLLLSNTIFASPLQNNNIHYFDTTSVKSLQIGNSEKKIFSFGVVADIQYADIKKIGKRDYRNSLKKEEKCIEIFNSQNLAFVISLGDMIERDYKSYDKPLEILSNLKAPLYNVIGNHDWEVDDNLKGEVKKRLHNKKGYFKFEVEEVVFIVLDGSDISTFAHVKGSRKYDFAMAKFEEMKKEGLNNAYTWNGGMGNKQYNWLAALLKKADKLNKKVIIFCHWPLLPEVGTQLWDNKKILDLIDNHNSVVAWIAGHHHEGNYVKYKNVHHLTLKGLVEAQSETSCGIIEMYADKLVLKGYGDQKDQVLKNINSKF